jgi:hypothetical protein
MKKKVLKLLAMLAMAVPPSAAYASSRLNQPDVHGQDLCQGWANGVVHPLPCFMSYRFDG